MREKRQRLPPQLLFPTNSSRISHHSLMRIHVVGTTGSGKSTLAHQLAAILGCPHVELDALHWEPGWQGAPNEIFRARIQAATAGDCWVVDGGYDRTRDVYWPRVQMMVWLDYPLWINLWRLTRRGVRRIVTREDLWGTGNRETWRRQFLTRDSLYAWAIKTHRQKRERYQQFFVDPANAHVAFVHLRSPRATARWLRSFERAS